jgi:hypothetical protein
MPVPELLLQRRSDKPKLMNFVSSEFKELIS